MNKNTQNNSQISQLKKLVVSKINYAAGFNIPIYEVNNQLLTKQLLTAHIQAFWETYISKSEYNFFAVFITIEYAGVGLKSLGKASKVNKSDLERYTKTMLTQLDFKDNQYFIHQTVAIHIWYRPIAEDALINTGSIIHEPIDKFKATTSNIFGYELPNNMNLFTWGKVIKQSEDIVFIEFSKNNVKYIYEIEIGQEFNLVKIKSHYLEDEVLLEFKDYPEKGSFTNFTRKVKKFEYIFRDGEILVTLENKDTRFIKSLAKVKRNFTKFITIDIETRTLDNIMIPYCICFYDGYEKYSFYITDFKDSGEMITKALRSILLNPNYSDHIVFAHNFSKFDGVFILKALILLAKELNLKINIIQKDSDFINISIFSESTGFSINFRDSLLLLPSSLKKLAKSFKVENKTIFPYSFVNEPNTDMSYSGVVPDFKYFNDITLEEYQEYATKFTGKWNLKYVTIRYCLQDCVTLFQVIKKFSDTIFKDLKVNLKFAATTSSLALRTFRTTFLNQNGLKFIPIIVGQTYDFIKRSFSGGHVDVYKTYGEDIYHYDVNSLYPSVMKEYPMPIGNPTYFEGDILAIKDRPYGFFEVEITAPEGLFYPILQTRVETMDGYRTVAPLGNWTDVLSSSEIYNAMDNFGYKFKIHRGFLFERDVIYGNYVDHFNKIKTTTPKDNPMYLISKLLMNGLFGKTGQDYKFSDTRVVSNEMLMKFIQDKTLEVSSITDLGNDQILISLFDKEKYSNNKLSLLNSFNGSIGHASEIAAGARINMSLTIKYLMENNYTIYYMDTDSFFIDKPLPDHLVSNSELGKYKLENIYKEAVFLAPKVYAGITYNGEETIKIKGLSHDTISKDVTFDLLKTLLQKDKSLTFNHTKVFRKFDQSTINLLEQTYCLIPTENKRQLVYDANNLLCDTKPYVIDHNKVIS